MSATCSLHSGPRESTRRRGNFRLARRVQLRPRMDLIALGIVVAFFALSWGFVVLCERL
jgi:hypothetical protein